MSSNTSYVTGDDSVESYLAKVVDDEPIDDRFALSKCDYWLPSQQEMDLWKENDRILDIEEHIQNVLASFEEQLAQIELIPVGFDREKLDRLLEDFRVPILTPPRLPSKAEIIVPIVINLGCYFIGMAIVRRLFKR